MDCSTPGLPVSPTPGVYSNSCLLSRWCHPDISSSSYKWDHSILLLLWLAYSLGIMSSGFICSCSIFQNAHMWRLLLPFHSLMDTWVASTFYLQSAPFLPISQFCGSEIGPDLAFCSTFHRRLPRWCSAGLVCTHWLLANTWCPGRSSWEAGLSRALLPVYIVFRLLHTVSPAG